MEFKPDSVQDFLVLFEDVKGKISEQQGCSHIELCKDAELDHVYYTYSNWDSEVDLERYRHSAFFADTWAKTKVLFGGKPMAFSLV